MIAIRDRRSLVAAELRHPSGLVIELLENGSIFAIRQGAILVNQVLGCPVEGAIGNLYLRRRRRAGVTAAPLVGPGSASEFSASSEGATWRGSLDELEYSCTLRMSRGEPGWSWTLAVTNRSGRAVGLDAVLAQDLGLAEEAAVRSSELYVSQYIDHAILEDDRLGVLVCSRQNLSQAGAHPWVMHGCVQGAVGYLTDGFQLYGLGYRSTNVPATLLRRRLPNARYQYEFALPTLQSRPLRPAAGASGEIVFFAVYRADHPARSGRRDAGLARDAARQLRDLDGIAVARTSRRGASVFANPVPFGSRELGPADLERHFGTERRQAERRGRKLLSFFHGDADHVVLRAKELAQERPTGHILRSGRDLLPTDELLSVTAWMDGTFASHLSIGNTSLHKLLGVNRNPLGVLKGGGQRIFVRTERGWELLGLPSAFEMGPSHARWIYDDGHRTLAVRTMVAAAEPACRVEVEILGGGPLELLVSHQVVLGANEHDHVPRLEIDGDRRWVELHPAPEEPMAQFYPGAAFFLVMPDPGGVDAVGGDELLHGDGSSAGGPFVVIRTKPVDRFALVLTGSLLDANEARERARAHVAGARPSIGWASPAEPWTGLRRGLRLGAPGRLGAQLARLNEALPWLVHDGLVHASVPHGLEQHSGAAWGVRDVCQGPAELLLAGGHAARLRDVIRTVYERQFLASGDWPQWFMFDRHREVQAAESHADVIHWPLKLLCDYVEATNDTSILDERVGYTHDRGRAADGSEESIFAHTERQLAAIEASFVPGTALVAFGGGDWEDTLQPADPAMARRMVSAWTVELAYQTLGRYRAVCERAGRDELAHRLDEGCRKMRADFNRHLLPDGVVAGLAHFGPDGTEYFLHPCDRATGVAYRLLPMTRGMISGIFDAPQASRHQALIARHLTFPDGVRLMDRPMAYRGGVSRHFRRAESAANFGREVGLQYVHAHIRYVEAMARVGRGDLAAWGLLAVCPVGLARTVPTALPRQANAYFSSSDAAFADRYQASREWERLRHGSIGFKGGWRVYSSGPGIYLHQLVANVLGLRLHFDDVVLDPVLPPEADGLTADIELFGRRVRFVYRLADRGFSPEEVRVNGRRLHGERSSDNPYRLGAWRMQRRSFIGALDAEENLVEVLA